MTEAEHGAGRFGIAGHGFMAPRPAPGLYVVATPIGNLKDITVRALEILAGADLVLCEDTRLSARLLDHYAIRARTSPLHEHNERARTEAILDKLATGAAIALISDAGTPLVSDPGFPLVRAARAAGHAVFAVPGPSAVVAALAVAGLPTDRFTFLGFLPPRAGARATALEAVATRPETLVAYESPRRLAATLTAMAAAFGEARPAAVALELTKRFERVETGTLGALAVSFAAAETRGEAVVLVAGAEDAVADVNEWQAALAEALGRLPLRSAVEEVTDRFGLKRKQVYDAALRLKSG